jgi:hypothetical protein
MMERPMSAEKRKAAFMAAAGTMYEELEAWFAAHPAATFGEIEQEARRQRRQLMGRALEIVVNGQDTGYESEGVACAQCGERMKFKGYLERTVYGLEGDTSLERAYYVCQQCEGQTLFPPGREAQVASGPLE